MQTQADYQPGAGAQAEVCGDDCHGSCLSGSLAVGYWKDKEDVKQNWDIDRVFQPDIEIEKQQKMLKGWKKLCSTHMDGQKKRK